MRARALGEHIINKVQATYKVVLIESKKAVVIEMASGRKLGILFIYLTNNKKKEKKKKKKKKGEEMLSTIYDASDGTGSTPKSSSEAMSSVETISSATSAAALRSSSRRL